MGGERENIGKLSVLDVMGRLPDPRSGHGRRHPLGAILGLAICAMLCGSRSLYAISQWGRDQGWRYLRPWDSLGTGLPACPRCTRCSAGWTGRPSKNCWASGCRTWAWSLGSIGHRR